MGPTPKSGAVDDRINAIICVASALGALAFTWPVAESGVNDDWSYVKTALDLAQTGRFQYNGWAAAMLGAQACWGALFIKLFGFSFLVLRLSTALLAAGCAVLAYRLHRCADLPPRLSLFGALTLALSPVFVPNAASFMTEIPGLFLFLVSVCGYSGVAGALGERETKEDASASARSRFWKWLVLALAAGLAAGTVRQVYWIVPALAPFYLCLRVRHRQRAARVMLPLVLSSILAIAGAMACSLWFSAQPYSIQENVGQALRLFVSGARPVALMHFLMRYAVCIGLTLGAMALPAVIAIPWRCPHSLKSAPQPRTFLLCLMLTLVLLLLAVRMLGIAWCFPWLPNTFGKIPYLSGGAPIEANPLTFSLTFWKSFSLLVGGLTCGALVIAGVTQCYRLRQSGARVAAIRNLVKWLDSVPVPLVLLTIFAAAYVPILLLKVLVPASSGVFDRYLLPVLPCVTIGLLGMYRRESGRKHLPWRAWLLLILFASFGIARAHDYFSQLRARQALAAQLEARGVPRTRIMGGIEYDGWTQLTAVGHVNDPRIRKPENSYKSPPALPFETVYNAWSLTPVVHPGFVISVGRHPDLHDTDLPPMPFLSWLPPYRRELVVQTPDPNLIPVRSFLEIPAASPTR